MDPMYERIQQRVFDNDQIDNLYTELVQREIDEEELSMHEIQWFRQLLDDAINPHSYYQKKEKIIWMANRLNMDIDLGWFFRGLKDRLDGNYGADYYNTFPYSTYFEKEIQKLK